MKRFKNKYVITYKISEDNSKVIALAKVVDYDKRYLSYLSAWKSLTGRQIPNFMTEETKNGTFIGIATYKDNDINDTEKAKKIAKKKALRTAYYMYGNLLKEIANDFLRFSSDVYNLGSIAKNRGVKLDSEIIKEAVGV